MRHICVITGSRAEFGILTTLLKKIQNSNNFRLDIIATGSHLSPEFGYTINEIKQNFNICKEIEILLSSDRSIGVCKSMGLAMISIGEALNELKPDMLLILGDRYEILASACAAHSLNIPIIHLYGGETTEGAIDDNMRHAITKLSSLHFTATEAYRQCVIQMGEVPERVHNVGSLGTEQITHLQLLDLQHLSESLGLKIKSDCLLCTYHPETNSLKDVEKDFQQILNALDTIPNQIVFTKANSDPKGHLINALIDDYVKIHPTQAVSFKHLGAIRYLSLLKYIKGVIGNSSSGIIEVPSFKIATINIGNRQKGRIQSDSVLNILPQKSAIINALIEINSEDFQIKLKSSKNPYEKENTSENILKIIHETKLDSMNKSFHHLSKNNDALL